MFHNKLISICAGALIIGTLALGTFGIYNNFYKSSHFSNEIVSDIDIYIEKKKKKYISLFINTSPNANSNIDKIFYDKKLYDKTIQSKNNNLESSWKSRILFENTPQGNVAMFFDAYKMCFAYYSDSAISYSVLNAVAMKYVTVFFCRDFFIDKSIIPDNNSTPFQYIHEIEIKRESNKNKIDVKNGPFAKLKTYKEKKEEEKNIKKDDSKEDVTKDDSKEKKDYIKNKFINKGKMRDLNILQNNGEKVIVKKQNPVQYQSYKQWRNPDANVF